MLDCSSIFRYKILPSELMVQYAAEQENVIFGGNALRNCRKLLNSGIIQPVIRYHIKCKKNQEDQTKSKPLRISIREGNPKDAEVLFSSVAAQCWKERFERSNKLPKGYTRSPKIGAENYAIANGLNPTEISRFISVNGKEITIFPEFAEAVATYTLEHSDQLGLLGLGDIL